MEYKTLGYIVIKNYPTANNRKTAAKVHFRNILLKAGIRVRYPVTVERTVTYACCILSLIWRKPL